MALLRYLSPKDILPDPNGSLSLSIPSRAISAINRGVQELTRGRQDSGRKRHGQCQKYTPEQCFEISRRASLHGITAAARYFSAKLEENSRYINCVEHKERLCQQPETEEVESRRK